MMNCLEPAPPKIIAMMSGHSLVQTVQLDHWAGRQLSDYDHHRPGLMFGDRALSLTVSDAYDIQRRVAALRQQRGETLAGYKIGCTSQPVRRQLGLDRPVFGHVFSSEMHPTGCVLSWASYDGLAIEGEFAVRLGMDVLRADWLLANHLRAIQSFFPVIELHNFVFRGPAQTAQELIANNAIHAGVLLPGREFPYRAAGDLLNRPLEVLRNGDVLGEADSRVLHDELPGRLALLAAHLAQSGTLLRKDQIVLTGSPLPLYPVSPGDVVEVRCPDFPAVTATIGP
jgi:2-keto-4-pentenoate hydratase